MKKILFITLSNIGDVVLTMPVLDYLKGTFPGAEITVMTGQRAQGIFAKDPGLKESFYTISAPL